MHSIQYSSQHVLWRFDENITLLCATEGVKNTFRGVNGRVISSKAQSLAQLHERPRLALVKVQQGDGLQGGNIKITTAVHKVATKGRTTLCEDPGELQNTHARKS